MLASAALGWLTWHLQRQTDFFDLNIYWGAIRSWEHGHDLYGYQAPHTAQLGFTYPPFAAVLLSPLGWLPLSVAQWAMTTVNLAVCGALSVWLGGALARRLGRPVAPCAVLAAALLLGLEPIRQSLGFGQINIVLLGLVALDMALIRRGSPAAGIAIGLAAAIKLTPAVLIVALIARGRRRAAAQATAAFLVAGALAAAIDRSASWRFWTQALWDTGRIGKPARVANQSLAGVLARLEGRASASTALWVLAAAGVLIGAVLLARAMRDPLGDARALTIGAVAATMISPISWTHHFWWAIPAFAIVGGDLLARRAGPSRAALWILVGACYAAFAVGPVYMKPFLDAFGIGVEFQFRSVLYPLEAIALVALIARGAPTSRRAPIAGAAPDSEQAMYPRPAVPGPRAAAPSIRTPAGSP